MLVVTSPNSGNRKTTVATNVAIALAETGGGLLIDADLCKPRIHALFALNNRTGLSSVLQKADQAEQAVSDQDTKTLYRATPIAGLFVLTSGPIVDGPTNLLYAKHFPDTCASAGNHST